MGREIDNAHPDVDVARIASRQHGVITTAQLLAAGIHSSGITKRLAAGRLHRVHRGVYAVGHQALSNEGRWIAGVLACGRGAVLSHRSAGALWKIWPRGGARRGVDLGSLVEVSVPRGGGRATRLGLRVHRTSTLAPTDCTAVSGIPVTKPQRTLKDLRRVVSNTDFAAALREAEFLGLDIGPSWVPDHTRSELEARFLALCRRHHLPEPRVNARVGGDVVDFLWPDQGLIVETDGWESHRSRSAFEQDRERDARLKVLGNEVLRLTWQQITSTPSEAAQTVHSLLSSRRRAGRRTSPTGREIVQSR